MPVLIVKFQDSVKLYEMPDGIPLFVGSLPDCDICLPSPNVSRRHAVFIYKNGIAGLKDLNSFNGTFINDELVTQPASLTNGDTIRIAQCLIKYMKTETVRNTSSKRKKMASSLPGPAHRETRILTRPGGGKTRKIGAVRNMLDDIEAKPAAENSGTDTQSFLSVPMEGERRHTDSAEDDAPYQAPQRFDTTIYLSPPESRRGRPDASRTDKFAAKSRSETDDIPDEFWAAAVTGDLIEEEPSEAAFEEEEAIAASERREDTQILTGVKKIKVCPELREVIETRLTLYSLLEDLAEERRFFRSQGDLPEDVLTELARQDRQFYVLPLGDEVDDMLMRRRTPKNALADFGTDDDQEDADSSGMPKVEEMALSQLRLMADSAHDDLPKVYARAYQAAAGEHLAVELTKAGINNEALLGGAYYFLALDVLLAEAKSARVKIKSRIQELYGTATLPEADSGGPGVLNKLLKNISASKADRGVLEKLTADELAQANRTIWIKREMVFLEKTLTREFWNVYAEAAIHFLPLKRRMTLPVRAFLRFGAISFQPWWIPKNAADAIVLSCSGDIVDDLVFRDSFDNILYADEYLGAIMDLETPPSPPDDGTSRSRADDEWRTERSLRKMVGNRAYLSFLAGAKEKLQAEIEDLKQQAAETERQEAEAAKRHPKGSDVERELQSLALRLHQRQTTILNTIKHIDTYCIEPTEELTGEIQEKFDSGKLVMPAPRYLIRQECEMLADISTRMAHKQGRLLPLAIRECFPPVMNRLNLRDHVAAALKDIRERDPGIFVNTLINAKKRQNRVDMDIPPLLVVTPAYGAPSIVGAAGDGTDGGRVFVPSCSPYPHPGRNMLSDAMADYRWGTSLATSGRDAMKSDTLAGAFMRIRWDWRLFPKDKREKGLIYNDINDQMNWRRVYGAYLLDAHKAGQRVFTRNYECYTKIFVPYFTPPEGVTWLKK